jgi:tricorn protease
MRLTTLLFLTCASICLAEPDLNDTKFLTQPAISKDHIAFVYADDLWICDHAGNNVRRLTSDIGSELAPVFSPDGQWLAFSAQYDGNTDVYLISTAGGTPKRLTTHPDPDVVRGFTPDGKAVLFSSPRNAFAFNNRHQQLYTVPVEGGMPTQLPIPHGYEAGYSPNGDYIAYNPNRDPTRVWKHYRGGTHGRIWIYRTRDHDTYEIPQPEGRCNDFDPQWIGDTVYFRSDRNGEYNLFAFEPKTKSVRQLTRFTDFPVIDLNAGGGRLIFEQAGHLHLYDPKSEQVSRVRVGVATDLVEARARFVKGAKYIRSASISPSGARAAFEFRGEIVTVPAEKGDVRNLTETTGAHERFPAWSPDGQSIAYFSDEGGEYRLYVKSADGKGDAKKYALGGNGYYERPAWSPDSKKIAYIDNSQSLYWIDLGSGNVEKIASEPVYGPTSLVTLRPAWSPDSRFISYTLGNKAAYHTIFVHDVTVGKSMPVTDGLSDAVDPVFDANGKYLYFFGSTDAGPVNQWFAQSNNDMRPSRSIYLAVLKKATPSPLARESDEEKGDKPAAKKKEPGKDEGPAQVVIDFDGIDQRVVRIPEPASNYRDLRAGPAGQFFYLDIPFSDRRDPTPPSGTLKKFDLSKRKSETVTTGILAYTPSHSGAKALVFAPPESWTIVDALGPPTPPKKLKTESIEVKIDPRAEWPQIYREAWRINRDYFYDPGMHGSDWEAVRKKYESFIGHAATRADVDRVLGWMLSELAVGHSGYAPGERLHERKPVVGGLLGADYEIANGRYRFKKVYAGLTSSPELRSPLTAPGVEVKAGEYLLAVGGKDLQPPTEVYSLFENSAGKSIEITVGPNPNGNNSRTVTVEPLANESSLRNLDWVQGNIKRVTEATKGRVAYVYVPNTAGPGHAYFKRFFFPQTDRDAVIVDERFNGGGQVADYYIDHLRRPFTAMWATRYGDDIKTPGGAIFGPKVMIIEETAGSGGDLLPWMFRQYKLGPLVGKRTWGGLVGVLGFPVLMDGSGVTAPNLGFWTKEEGFGVENVGVPPDIDVDQWPKDVAAGRDPQLEKAIEVALKELEKKPPEKYTRPAFPVRVKK